MLDLVAVEELELAKGFLHFVNSTGTVEELDGVRGFREGVAGDEREKGDGLASAGGHFEETVASGV